MGPELVRLPTGSMVYPAGQSKMMAGQGAAGRPDIHLHFDGLVIGHPAEIGRQVTEYIKEFERSNGSRWRS
jgi:hypothetical protein